MLKTKNNKTIFRVMHKVSEKTFQSLLVSMYSKNIEVYKLI